MRSYPDNHQDPVLAFLRRPGLVWTVTVLFIAALCCLGLTGCIATDIGHLALCDSFHRSCV